MIKRCNTLQLRKHTHTYTNAHNSLFWTVHIYVDAIAAMVLLVSKKKKKKKKITNTHMYTQQNSE